MTLSKGNGEGETVPDKLKHTVDQSVKTIITRIITGAAVAIVIPLMLYVSGNIIRSFEEELAKIRDAQKLAVERMNEKLDRQKESFDASEKWQRERDFEMQLKLEVIEELLRKQVEEKKEPSKDLKGPKFPLLFENSLGAGPDEFPFRPNPISGY